MKRLVLTAIAALALSAVSAASTGGNLLCHLSFDDAANPLKAEVGKDAFEIHGKGERVIGLAAVKHLTEGGDGGVTVPLKTSIAIPVPDVLANESGRPYSVLLKLKLHGMAFHPILNMPADKMGDALVNSSLYGRLFIAQHEKSISSRGGYGVVPQSKIITLLLCFGADSTTAFIDGKQIFSTSGLIEGKLAGSRADCSKAGGNFLLRGLAEDFLPADITFYDVKIYDGVVDPRDEYSVGKKTPAENAGGAENKNSPPNTTSPSPVATPTANNPVSPAGDKNGQTDGETKTNGGGSSSQEGGVSGSCLCHISFDDSANPLKAEGGADAVVRRNRAEKVSGMGEVKWEANGGDGAVAIPIGWHIAVPIPDVLTKEPGLPFSVSMKVKFSQFARDTYPSLLNMPADNASPGMLYLVIDSQNVDPVIYVKQWNKNWGAGEKGKGGFTAEKWENVLAVFDRDKTEVFLNGNKIISCNGKLAGSFADCSKAGGYILLSADPAPSGGTIYWADLKIYAGTEGTGGGTTPSAKDNGRVGCFYPGSGHDGVQRQEPVKMPDTKRAPDYLNPDGTPVGSEQKPSAEVQQTLTTFSEDNGLSAAEKIPALKAYIETHLDEPGIEKLVDLLEKLAKEANDEETLRWVEEIRKKLTDRKSGTTTQGECGEGGVPGAAEPGAPLRWYHRQNAYKNLGWDLPPEQYTFMGEPDTIKVMYHKGKAGGVEDEYLIHSQNRLDGWFKVTKEQAGAWKLRQNYDDYMALDIDGKRLIANKDWRTIEKADWTATEGWHKFMIVYGDAYVGIWGRVALDLDAAIMVAMNGGAEVPFEDAVEFHVAKAQEVPGVRVPAAGDKGLVAYWPFDGSAHDVSGNGHHGTVRGASLTADRNGRANSAYHFEASDYACIRVPNSPALEKIERSVTIAAWVKPEKLDHDWVPIAIKGAHRYQFGLNVEKQNKFIMCSDRDIAERNVYVNAATKLKLGEWQHVAVTCDGVKMKVFINGKCMGVRVANTKFPANNDEFFIGRDHKTDSKNYTGDIDEFCIYSRALSDEEVSALCESVPDGGKDGVGSGGTGSGAGGDGDHDSGLTETPPAEPPIQPGEPKSGDGGSTEPPTGGEPPDHADPAGGGGGGSDGGKDGPKTGGGGGAEPDGGGNKPEEDPEGYLPPEEGERPKNEVVIKGPPWESGDGLPPPEQESPPDNMTLCGYFKKVGTKVIYFFDGEEAMEVKTKKGTIYYNYPKQISATHNSLYFIEDELLERTKDGPRFGKSSVQFRWSEPDDRIDLYVKDADSEYPSYEAFPKCNLNFSVKAHWAIYETVEDDALGEARARFTGVNAGARLAFGKVPKDFEFDKELKAESDVPKFFYPRGEFIPATGFGVRDSTNKTGSVSLDNSIKDKGQRIAVARKKAIEKLRALESQDFEHTGTRSDYYVNGIKHKDYFTTNSYYVAGVRVETLDGLVSYACFLYEYRNDTTPKGGYWNRVSNNVERVEKSELNNSRTAYAEAFETRHKVVEEYFKTKTDLSVSPPKTEKVKAARFAFQSNCSRPPKTGLPGQKFSMRVKYSGVKNDILAEVKENPVNYETYMSFRQYGPTRIFHFDGDCYDESKLGASNRERGLVAGVSTWPTKGLWAVPESKTRLNLRDNMVWAEFPEGPEGEDSDRWLEVSYWDRPDSGYGVFNIAKTTWYYEWVPGEEPPELPKEEEPPFEEEDEDDGEAAIKFAQNGMGLPANKDKFVRKSEDKKKNKVGLDEYRIPFLVMNMPTNREYTVKATLRRIGATGENGTYLEADAITNEIPYSVVAEKDKKYGDKGIWEAVIKETGTYELPAGTTEGIQLKIEAESGKNTDKDYVKVSETFPIYRIHLGLSLMLQANTIPCHWKMREESKYKLDKQDIAGDPEKDPEGKYVIEQEDFDVPMREGSFMLLLYDEDLEDFIRIPAIPTNTCVTATKVANDRYCKVRDAEADHQTMVDALGIEVMSTGNKRQNGAHIVMVAPTKAVLDSPVRLVADLTVDTIFGGKTYTAKKRVLLHSQPLRAIETMEDEKKYLEHDEHIRKQLLRIMFKIESTCPDRLFSIRNMIERMLDGYDYRFGYDPHQIETIMEMYVGFQEGTFEGANGTPYKVSIGDDLKACYAFMQGLRDNTTVLGRMAMGIMTGGVSEHVFTTMTVLENMQKEIMTCKDVNKFGLLEATKIGAEEIGKQILIELAVQGALAGAGAVAEKGLGLDVQQTLKNIGARYRKVMDGADSWLKNNSKAYALGDKALQGCKNYLGSGTKAAADTIERTILSEEEAAKRAEQLLKKSRKNLTPDELADVAKYEKAMENGMNKVRNLQAAQQAMEKARGTNKFKAAQEKYFESCNEVWTDKCALKKLNQINHEYAYKMRQEFNSYREGLLDKVQQEALGDIANKLKVSREELYIHNISKNKLANNTTPKGGKTSAAKGGKNSSSKGGKKNTAKGNEKTYTDGSKTPNDRDVTMMKKNAADRTKDLTIDQTLGEEALARRLWKRMHKNQEPPSMKEALEFMKGKDVSYVNPNGDASSYVFEHNLEGYEDLAGTLGIGKDGKYCESLLAKDLHNPAINAACIKYKGTEWWGPRVKAKYAEAAKLEALAQKYKGSAKQKLLDQAMDLRYRAVGDMCEGIRQIVKQTEGIIIPRGNYRCGGNPLPTHLQELHALAKRVGTDVSPTEFVKVLKSHNLDLNSWADTVSKYVNAKSLPAPKTNFPNIVPPKAINDALDREIEKKNGRR